MDVNPSITESSRHVPIMPMPAPVAARPGDIVSMSSGHAGADDPSTAMPFNCQACVRKKIKCDRHVPGCSSCRRSKLQCVYKAPPPRRSRRERKQNLPWKPDGGHLALAESVVASSSPYTLSPSTHGPSTPAKDSTPTSASAAQSVKTGKLLTSDGKTRYVDNVMLLQDGDGEEGLCDPFDPDEDDSYSDDSGSGEGTPTVLLGLLAAHTVSGSVLGATRNLAELHPSHLEAMSLWHIYTQNVEPLCKILHTPTVGRMVEAVSKKSNEATKNEECLLFVIYYCAVLSMSDADCLQAFDLSRSKLMSKYRMAFCQALVNASWLKTKALPVLQAYILFLIATRGLIDPDTFWILTGIAVRLAQRMGLHCDGEKLGLDPFEVQMRRRIFWQLLPLDGYAGQVSGSGISIPQDSWDTLPPQNINDDQIFPGMTEQPVEQTKATEMIFCLARMELTNFYNRTGVQMKQGGTIQFREAEEIEKLIDDVEALIETKFLRYCDILNPLHFLTTGVVRSATNAVRLRTRMPPLIKQTISDGERKSLCALAENILDTNSAIYNNPNMTRFRWQMRSSFLWDALLCILLSLSKVGFYSSPSGELDATWAKVAEVYGNHRDELIRGKKPLHVYIGRITLKAWIANPPTTTVTDGSGAEPGFIVALRAQERAKVEKRLQHSNDGGNGNSNTDDSQATNTIGGFLEDNMGTGTGSMDGIEEMDLDDDGFFNLDSADGDWDRAFWDQLLVSQGAGSDMG